VQLLSIQREPGDIPVGALLMVPLCFLPLGAWLLESGRLALGECGMKMLFGLPCFTCGGTRATIHLLRGDLAGALALQPLIILLYGGFLAWGLASFGTFLVDRRLSLSLTSTESTIAKISLLAAPFANWAYLIAAGI